MGRFILASASPQRRRLLEALGVHFDVVPSGIDEREHREVDPVRRAELLATLKAADVGAQHPGAWVLGCDTLVVAADGALLEKPSTAAEAREMLWRQSGQTSLVHSGLCLLKGGCTWSGVSRSSVTFRTLSETEVEWWIGLELWQGRSGAFQIEGPGQLLVHRMEGDWTGVVGLPLSLLQELVVRAGVFPSWPPAGDLEAGIKE